MKYAWKGVGYIRGGKATGLVVDGTGDVSVVEDGLIRR